MAIAFRAQSAVTSATRTTTTIAMPSGVLAGDEVRIVVNAGQGGATAPTFTAPGTATLVATVTWGDGSYTVRHSVYRYRVVGTGDPASFAFTHASATSDGGAFAYSGVDATTPDDATPVTTSIANTGPTSFNAILNGITTVTANTMLVVARGSWDGNAITPPAGWTERLDQAITWVGEQADPTAGATGTISVPSGSTVGVAPAAGIVMALRPSSGGGSFTGTLGADTPTVSVTTPTAAWSGAVTVPTFAGAVAADLPPVSVSVPLASWSGSSTVPAFTGALDATIPTIAVDVPGVSWSGFTGAPSFAGVLDALAPPVDIAVPTLAWIGSTAVPIFTGTVDAMLPTVAVGVPTSEWSGTVTAPGFTGTLTADTPALTVVIPTMAWTGAVSGPGESTGTLSADTPEVAVLAPVATWVGTTAVPTYSGALAATLPTVSVGVLTSAWTGAAPNGDDRDITVTATIDPRRWGATIEPGRWETTLATTRRWKAFL